MAHVALIVSFRHKGLEKFYLTGSVEGVQPAHRLRLQILLTALAHTVDLQDLRSSTFGLHSLKGSLEGWWALKVNHNWRLIFRFDRQSQQVSDIDYVDYH